MKKGFTLIELLVVVLIIGILAAMALPQYMKAVEKSRAAEGVQLLRALMNAEKIYQMATGNYTYDLTALDIEMPNISTNTSRIATSRNFRIRVEGIYDGSGTAPELIVVANRVDANGNDPAEGSLQDYSLAGQILANGTEQMYCHPDGGVAPETICKSISNGATKNSSGHYMIQK